MPDYLIRVPGEHVPGGPSCDGDAMIAAPAGTAFEVVAEIPESAAELQIEPATLDHHVDQLVQHVLDAGGRLQGDYAIFIQSAVTEDRPWTTFSWYYKPSSLEETPESHDQRR